MFCTKCGKEISNEALFCPECGNRLSNNAASTQTAQNTYQPQPTYHRQTPPASQPATQTSSYSYKSTGSYDDYVDESARSSLGTSILILGILSLVFVGIPGWIMGAISRNKADEYSYIYGAVTGKAQVGKILGTIGLVFSIIYTISMAVIGSVYFCAIASML